MSGWGDRIILTLELREVYHGKWNQRGGNGSGKT